MKSYRKKCAAIVHIHQLCEVYVRVTEVLQRCRRGATESLQRFYRDSVICRLRAEVLLRQYNV
jgi:hypothetical protein